MERGQKTALVVIALMALALILWGCAAKRVVPIENVRTEIEYRDRMLYDSVLCIDSIYIKEKADTMYVERVKYVYKSRAKTDTFVLVRNDTVCSVVEVERALSKSERFYIKAGHWLLPWFVLFLAALFCYLSWRLFRR